MKTYDFVVIGSGIAGLSFALRAARHGSVALITKRARGEANTTYAQGGIACVTSDDDSFDLHVADTLTTGAGLCDEEVVRAIISEGPERIRELVELGVRFDGNGEPASAAEAPAFALAREGGHSRRRILHARDATGREIERALLRALAGNPAIEVFENQMAVDLITSAKLGLDGADRCVGVYVLDEATGEVATFRTDRLVLATGGCGRVYLYTTNPGVATGDGVAMAWRAGASVANMEFIQFHPTCLFHPAARSFLISEAVRGEGGRLVDAGGRPFMARYHPLADLAPRDVVARAIDAEMKRTGAQCAYLDITHQSAEFLRERFPTIYEKCHSLGLDIARDPIPVVPAAHYQCGGVLTDLDGATTLPGLYAIGEVACTGLHGANRLASNSLLEAVVVAHRAAEEVVRRLPVGERPLGGAASREIDLPAWIPGKATDVDEMVVIYHNWDEIRRLMWDYVGIVRSDKRLQRARARLQNLLREIDEFYWDFKLNTDLLELRNLATVAALIVDSALERKESRGLHYTLDYPEPDEGARRDTVLRKR
jgi:L-aspartate oxidase